MVKIKKTMIKGAFKTEKTYTLKFTNTRYNYQRVYACTITHTVQNGRRLYIERRFIHVCNALNTLRT